MRRLSREKSSARPARLPSAGRPLPIVLAGGASGQLKGGRHLRFPKDTHMSNLLLAMLDKRGVRLQTFGDSTEMLAV